MNTPGFVTELSIYRSTDGYQAARKCSIVDGTGVVQAALHWGSTWSHCEGTRRKYAAVLWDIPWGANWIDTCNATDGPAEVGGRKPDLCEEGWFHVWGNWWISDPECCECTRWVSTQECSGNFQTLPDCMNSGCQCCSRPGGGYGCLNPDMTCVSWQCG
jgi:hypothetical protein